MIRTYSPPHPRRNHSPGAYAQNTLASSLFLSSGFVELLSIPPRARSASSRSLSSSGPWHQGLSFSLGHPRRRRSRVPSLGALNATTRGGRGCWASVVFVFPSSQCRFAAARDASLTRRSLFFFDNNFAAMAAEVRVIAIFSPGLCFDSVRF